MTMLTFSDITIKLHTVTMFVTVELQIIIYKRWLATYVRVIW